MVRRYRDRVGSLPFLVTIDQQTNVELELSGPCRALRFLPPWGGGAGRIGVLNSLDQVDFENI